MYLTVEENQRMARAAEADIMHSERRSPPSDRKRVSLNSIFPGYASRQAPYRADPSSLCNIVYWPNREARDKGDPASLDAKSITHLIYTAATVDHDGTVRLSDESPNFGMGQCAPKSGLEACMALKHVNPDLQVLVSVGGTAPGTHNLDYVAGSDKLSRAFGKAARSFASRYELDGIELDWSSASNEEAADRFLKLTATTEGYLSPDFGGRWFKLCVAIPGHLLHSVNLRETHKLVDFINIKAFDITTSQTSTTMFHAPVYGAISSLSCVSTIDLLQSRGANMRKVVLGVPCFGRAYIGAKALQQPYRESSEVPYHSLPLRGTQEQLDEQFGAAYCVSEPAELNSGKRVPVFVSYDNPRTVVTKAKLVRDRGLGGLCFYTGADDKTGQESLIRTGFLGLDASNAME